MFLLLITTPLSVLSQQKYIIKSDTVVVFTMAETRKVAIELLKGDQYAHLYKIQSDLLLQKDSLLTTYKNEYQRLDTLLTETNEYCFDLAEENTNLQTDLDESVHTTKILMQASGISILINIILLIICL